MRLYNTLTRKAEEFKPIHDRVVTLYTCGPTVYDRLHIGNWVAYISWDTLVRLLEHEGYQVKRVLNITDVGHLVSDADEGEDKLETGAKREGKNAWEIAKLYSQDFLEGMRLLNLIKPTYCPRATEHINEQIELIKKLEAKGYTYKISDGIYFDISKFPSYGDFARLDLSDQMQGARIAVNPEKKQVADFALWKFSPPGKKRDMEWDSPWGRGFPGWHLECSAMAIKYLDSTIDIHTGGIDHIPVHHTNEIAQSEAATGRKFANYWLHNNFLQVEGQKISKSLGNGYTLDDLKERGYSPLDFKMFVLQSHYRSESNFTWENLKAAKSRLQDLLSFADLRWQPSDISDKAYLMPLIVITRDRMLTYLSDDLNTPLALAELSQLIDKASTRSITQPDVPVLEDFLAFLDSLFGLNLSNREDINSSQRELINQREEARLNKDWDKADKLRKQLGDRGIAINDTPSGPVWSRLRP